jgi:hypothetical protein
MCVIVADLSAIQPGPFTCGDMERAGVRRVMKEKMITIALSKDLIFGETQLLLTAGMFIQSTGWPFLETSLRSFFRCEG